MLRADADHHRAWLLSGLAVRYAQALGLHLRNETSARQMSDQRKEQAVRVWGSLYSLETTLGVMTGRPSAINDRETSTSLPVALDDECSLEHAAEQRRPCRDEVDAKSPQDPMDSDQLSNSPSNRVSSAFSTPSSHQISAPSKSASTSTGITSMTSPTYALPIPPDSSVYFLYRSQLFRLIHFVLADLYNVEALHGSWADTQKSIEKHTDTLKRWQSTLPAVYDFSTPNTEQVYLRERLGLGMLFWSNMTLIGRPCLCRMEGAIPNESRASRDFNRRTAAHCVHAACEFLQLLPDEPDPVALYRIAPWWAFLHYLSQAASVILLELAFRVAHVPDEAPKMLLHAKKAVKWLRSLATESLAADRAWHLMDGLLRRVAPRVGGDVSDMPKTSARQSDTHAHADPANSDSDILTPAEARAEADALAFDIWQQAEDQQNMFRDFETALGAPFVYGSNSSWLFDNPALYSDPGRVVNADRARPGLIPSTTMTTATLTGPASIASSTAIPVPATTTPAQLFPSSAQMDLMDKSNSGARDV